MMKNASKLMKNSLDTRKLSNRNSVILNDKSYFPLNVKKSRNCLCCKF